MAQADIVFRDFVTDGVPSSGANKVKKAEVRKLHASIDASLAGLQAGGGIVFQTKVAMTLTYAANQMAWVIADATAANNGIYQKVGASGSGSWTRVGDLPYSFIRASNVGAGTASAIVATSSIPVPSADGGALITVNVAVANTGPATISFNGAAPLDILSSSGSSMQAGYLTPGMLVAGFKVGSTFRLLSDIASAAIQTAAENAAEEAAGYAAGLNLPAILSGDAGKTLIVKVDESGYELLPSTGGIASPRSYGAAMDGVTDDSTAFANAIAAETFLLIDGPMKFGSTVVASKTHLQIMATSNASIIFAGSSGSNRVIELTDVESLIINGPLTIDCDGKAATGLLVRAADGAERVVIDGVTVVDPFLASPATYGADGIFVQCDSGRGEILSITNCTVRNVNRSVVGGTCCGITANDFKVMTVTDNIVDGVFMGAGGTVDADGIKVFSQVTAGDYDDALTTIERNTIINCEGRFVKTQTRGKASIRNNTFRIDQAINLQIGFNAVDCQIDGATIEDNFFDFRTAWTGGDSLMLVYLRVPAPAPTYAGQQIFGAVRNNKAIIQAAAPDISRFVYMDISALSSRAYTVNFDVEGNFATTTAGWGAASIGVFFGTISVPVAWAAGATAKIRVRGNDIDTTNWLQGLTASGGTAAHGGLGDLTGKLSLEVSNNKCPRAADIPVMEYSSNQCFTSSISIWGNSIGIRCNSWLPPFDFAKILGGNEFYLPATTTPAHKNNPSSFTISLVSRKGVHLVVDMYGGIKTNRTMSITEIGTTPSWS